SHLGLRAMHTYLPCRISQWCALLTTSDGKCLIKCFFTSKGVLAAMGTNQILLDTLNTWVSTGMLGWFQITEVMTLAVFLPTPGSLTSSLTVEGISLSKSSTSIFPR